MRSPQSFVDEIEWLYEESSVRRFYVVDEQFTFDESRAKEICRNIIERRLEIEWQVNSRVDKVSLDLLHLMKEAGCIYEAVSSEGMPWTQIVLTIFFMIGYAHFQAYPSRMRIESVYLLTKINVHFSVQTK